MNKEEILKKAKQEGLIGVDDGTRHMQNQGRLFGRMAFTAVYVVIAIFSLITDNEINAGITAMFLACLTGEILSEWKSTKKKVYLFFMLIGAVSTVIALIITISGMFGATI